MSKADDPTNEDEGDMFKYVKRSRSNKIKPDLSPGLFDWGIGGLVALSFAAVILAGPAFGIIWHSTSETKTCTITDKSAGKNADGATDYRVYTDNCGVIGVGDDLFIGKWDSADRYGTVHIGKTYDLTYIGWRFPLTSTFPNLVESKESVK